MVYFMMADGFEEAEALVPYDILTRCGLTCKLVSITDQNVVTGSHGIRVLSDLTNKNINLSEVDCIVLPGGGIGTKNLDESKFVDSVLKYAFDSNLIICAICAAPSILGKRGYLNGVKATCYPGYEKYLTGALLNGDRVVCDGNIITAKGAGAAYEFGAAIASILKDPQTSKSVIEKIY